jgi:hypothetical protein
MYIVYDKTTKKILRHVTEAAILAENEAALETTPETQRADIDRVRNLGTITAGAVAPIGAAAQARQAALDAFDLLKCGHGDPVDRFLPHLASSTGESPATHCFCFFRGSPEMVNGCVGYSDFKKYGVCELADSQDEFLTRHGLKAVR